MPAFPLLEAGLSQLPRRRLLIVGSEMAHVQALHQIFNDEYDIYMATSGQQTLNFCLGNPPDLVLLNASMPDMTGQEICQRLKANPITTNIPVIFVTEERDPNGENLALAAGGGDIVTEPVNPPVVKARVRTHLTLKSQSDLFLRLALIDELTGVANRRYFEQALQTEWRYCRRKSVPLAIVMVDVDFFTRYNAHYSQQQGDSCLQNIGTALRQDLHRPHDLVARYTGESFVCLLPETDFAGAQLKANSFRSVVERLAIPHADSPVASYVTVSVGFAVRVPDDSINSDDVLSEANLALFEAKSNGRNQVRASALDMQK